MRRMLFIKTTKYLFIVTCFRCLYEEGPGRDLTSGWTRGMKLESYTIYPSLTYYVYQITCSLVSCGIVVVVVCVIIVTVGKFERSKAIQEPAKPNIVSLAEN